jgi:hypothetical protein
MAYPGQFVSTTVLILSGAVAVCAAGQVRATQRDAEAMRQKVADIVTYDNQSTKQARLTTVTENEVNSYLQYDLRDELPVGVVEPSVSALGPGRLSGRAVVDLDAVRKAGKSTGLLDLRSLLTGRLPVTATGLLHVSNGVGRFELESATIGGVPIPKRLLQEIIAHYSKSAEDPDGVGLDEPFEMPAHIREIQVQRGHAVIVQ